MTSRIEVVARVSGRRYWTVEQKLGMLRDAFGSGGSVRAAIERHEISSGLLYTWRKQAMSGELTGIAPVAALPDFAEVRIAAHQAPIAALPPPPSTDVSGRISIELPSGIRINVDAQVDAAALARVLAVLPS
jgi:transposase